MKGLQEAINQTLTIANKNCSRCSNENIAFTLTLGEHSLIQSAYHGSNLQPDLVILNGPAR